ncbi:MAG TPA: hypothetical protein ENN81_06265 [Phycisphaerales bacterium]|nr:hypothetical protein [Phycisphaerales bacterium]
MDSQVTVHARTPWWRQPGLYVLILTVLGIYFTRITDMPFGGDEPTWACVAREMTRTGDWIAHGPQNSGLTPGQCRRRPSHPSAVHP